MPQRSLGLADDLHLPLDFATEGVGIVGMRGSGKSSTEVRWAEVCYEAGIPFVAVDPKGDWWGIRSSGDGKGPGLSVPVFGGLHGDFPLEPHMGAQIADLLVDHMLSAVLDVSQLSIAGRTTFLVAFCNQLMKRHQREPHVRSVILEEAHRLIPQEVKGETAKLKEAAAAILLEGRAWGLGCWAPTQRPARLHKDVLEEVGNFILFRIPLTARNDKRAIADWFKHHDLGDEILASLSDLPPGRGWFVAPSLGIVKMVQMHRRRTFDSGATPKVGASLRPPSTLADIDASAITAALAEQIEKAKAEDPHLLRRRIHQLERELVEYRTELTERVARFDAEYLAREAAEAARLDAEHALREIRTVEVPVLSDADRAFLDDVRTSMEAAAFTMEKAGPAFAAWVADIEAATASARLAYSAPDAPTTSTPRLEPPERTVRPPAARPERPVAARPGTRLSKDGAPRRILMVLAQHGPLPAARVAFMAQVSATKSTLRNALSTLRGPGWITDNGAGCLVITEAGLAELGDFDPLPTGEALLDYWRAEIGNGKPRDIFEELLAAYPNELTAPVLAERLGIDPTVSTLRNGLSTLRSLGVVEGNRVSPALMEAIG